MSRIQTTLIGIIGLIVGIALAFCFFRVTAVAFQIVSFLFWVLLGMIAVAVLYATVRFRWGRRG